MNTGSAPGKPRPRDQFREAVARNLRLAREAHRPPLSQEALGKLFVPPINRAAVSQWEAVKNGTLPTVDKLAVLARHYGITLDELMFGQGVSRRAMAVAGDRAADGARLWGSLGAIHQEAVLTLMN